MPEQIEPLVMTQRARAEPRLDVSDIGQIAHAQLDLAQLVLGHFLAGVHLTAPRIIGHRAVRLVRRNRTATDRRLAHVHGLVAGREGEAAHEAEERRRCLCAMGAVTGAG